MKLVTVMSRPPLRSNGLLGSGASRSLVCRPFARVLMVSAACAGLVGFGETRAQPAASAPSEERRIVVLGDSLAAGLGVEPGQAFPALLQGKINNVGGRDRVVNAGVSGDTSADGLARIDWLLKQRTDVLILELGGNDGLRGLPASATKTNLQAIINQVKRKAPQAQIVLAGMQMPPNMGQDYMDSFKRIFPELAEENHAALVPFLLEGVGGRPELNQPDHIHPTAEGHKIVAENVWKVLGPMLARGPEGRIFH